MACAKFAGILRSAWARHNGAAEYQQLKWFFLCHFHFNYAVLTNAPHDVDDETDDGANEYAEGQPERVDTMALNIIIDHIIQIWKQFQVIYGVNWIRLNLGILIGQTKYFHNSP